MPVLRTMRSEPLAVGSRSAPDARRFADHWGLPRSYGSYASLLEDDDVDVVYIPLPNHLHCQWIIRAVEAGKHVLCEKPLVLGAEEFKQVRSAARRHSRVVLEAFQFRYHPQIPALRKLIASQRMGEILWIRGSFSFLLEDQQNIRLNPDTGGGSLWDIGCYPVCLMQALLQEDPVEVTAWQRAAPNGVDLTMIGQLRYPGGTLGQFDSSFETPFRVGAEIAGRQGSVKLNQAWRMGIDDGPCGRLIDAKGQEEALQIPDENPFLSEVQAIEAAVLDGVNSPYSLAESGRLVVTLQALYESARSGAPVSPDYRVLEAIQ